VVLYLLSGEVAKSDRALDQRPGIERVRGLRPRNMPRLVSSAAHGPIHEMRAREARRTVEDGHEPVLEKSRGRLLKRRDNLTDKQSLELRDIRSRTISARTRGRSPSPVLPGNHAQRAQAISLGLLPNDEYYRLRCAIDPPVGAQVMQTVFNFLHQRAFSLAKFTNLALLSCAYVDNDVLALRAGRACICRVGILAHCDPHLGFD